MGSLFSSPSTPDVVEVPVYDDTAAEEAARAAAEAEAAAARKRKGMKSTILTGAQGDTSMAPTQKAELLGG
jgi:hypothetical protein